MSKQMVVESFDIDPFWIIELEAGIASALDTGMQLPFLATFAL
jgi:hypothetical protein